MKIQGEIPLGAKVVPTLTLRRIQSLLHSSPPLLSTPPSPPPLTPTATSRTLNHPSPHALTVTQTSRFMNALSGAGSGLARTNGPIAGGTIYRSPVGSPVSVKPGAERGRKRRQNTAGLESSPGSGDGEAEGNEERRRQPGVKRACNECRQQKVSSPVKSNCAVLNSGSPAPL